MEIQDASNKLQEKAFSPGGNVFCLLSTAPVTPTHGECVKDKANVDDDECDLHGLAVLNGDTRCK